MDKNTITGLLLIMAILIGYGILTRPSQEEIAREQQRRDSIIQANRAEQLRMIEEKRVAEEQAFLPVSILAEDDSLGNANYKTGSALFRRRR